MTKAKQEEQAVVATEPVQSVSTRTADVIAAEIRFIDAQARQYVLQSAIEIGNKLNEAKDLVAHGEWGEWLQNNVNYSKSTANNFMKISTEYQGSQSFVNLSYSQAVALLSLPAEEREEFVANNDVEDMSTRELQAAIKVQQELEQQLKEQEATVAAQKIQFDKWAAERKKEMQQLEERYKLSSELREVAEKQVEDLTTQLEKAKAAEDGKEITKIKRDLRKAEKDKQEQEKKAAQLAQQLNDIKAAVEKEAAERLQQREQELKAQAEQQVQAVTEQAQKDKQSFQEQMQKLEQQLARSNNEAFLQAKFQLDQLLKAGDALVKTIATVKEADEQNKLKAAAAKVVDQLRSLL
jgi:DNA repair exonuclease SbcCD ATPase subunit